MGGRGVMRSMEMATRRVETRIGPHIIRCHGDQNDYIICCLEMTRLMTSGNHSERLNTLELWVHALFEDD